VGSLNGNYALGWNNDKISVGHGGGYFCTITQYTILPKTNIGIVINCNTYQFNMQPILNKFIEIFK
jgi:hypothetical protein